MRYWRNANGTATAARTKKTSRWPNRMIGTLLLRYSRTSGTEIGRERLIGGGGHVTAPSWANNML